MRDHLEVHDLRTDRVETVQNVARRNEAPNWMPDA